MREVVVVCPQERDLREIRAAGLEQSFGVSYAGADLDAVDKPFDAATFVDEYASIPWDGVVATKDRSALLAALIAERAGLASPTPQALLNCQYKPASRLLQREAVPEAVPKFAYFEGPAAEVPFPFPFFVKPAVGRLSENARRVDELAQFRAMREDGYPDRYAPIALLAGLPPRAVHGFLAEELLEGDEVTLEGYSYNGDVVTIGVTDSVKYSGTNSFERFEYPSRFGPDRHAELVELADRLVPALGFDNGFFNIELFVPERGPVRLIEVNGRIASQFAPLVRALHGRSTYEALFRLACGEDPTWRPDTPEGVAISYCLRTFEDAYVQRVPEPEDGLEILVRPGRRLAEQGTNDSQSYRLAIFYEVGETREEALARCRARARALDFALVPMPARRRPRLRM
jgi:biotin carboxylase